MALPRLFPFLRGSLFARPIFFNWKQVLQYVFEKEGDDRAKKTALFFLACEANPNTRLLITTAMSHESKGDSDVEATDRILVQQVRRESPLK